MEKAQLPVNAELSLGADTQDIKPTSEAEAIAACDEFGASLQVLTKDGGTLTKHITLENGKLIKNSSECRMSSGTVETVTFNSMAELSSLLKSLNANQAIALATTYNGKCSKSIPQPVLSSAKLSSNPLAISRTKEYFKFDDGKPALVLFDRDSSDGTLMTRLNALQALEAVIPDFDKLGVLVTHSSSSFIYGIEGEEFAGEGNHHTYLVVANGADIPRFAKALEGWLWLKGYGRSYITKSGAILLRTVFDLAVFSPERLVFEAGASLGKGLVQARPGPWFREGKYLDTTLLPDLTVDQMNEVTQLKAVCRAENTAAAELTRTFYLKFECEKLVKTGLDKNLASWVVANRQNGQLDDDDRLFFDHMGGVSISVGEVRKRRAEFIEKSLADPLEPDYTGSPGSIVKGKAKCLMKANGDLFINSFAHGGTHYQLTGETLGDFEVIVLSPEELTESGNAWRKNRERANERTKTVIREAGLCGRAPPEITRREYQKQQNEAIGHGENDVTSAEIVTLDDAINRFVFLSDGSRVADINNPHFDLAFSDWSATYSASKMKIKQTSKTRAQGRYIEADDKEEQVSKLWKASPKRKTVVCRTFKAGGNLMINDPHGRLALNIWKSYDRTMENEDLNAAGLGLFLNHINFLFPDENDASRFLDWLAHIEQQPGVLPHTAWLHIASNFGMGRNWLASVLSRVWAGNVAANLDLPRLLKDGFTGQLSCKVLAIVDEIREGGRDSQWEYAEKLKSLITEETRLINPKYGRQTIEYNACRWLMFSNHLSAIPMEAGDRRIEVVSIDAAPQPPEYYEQLYAALKSPEFITAVAAYLGRRNIAHFKPGAHAVKTDAKIAATKASQSPMAERAELLVTHWPADLIITSDLYSVLTGDEPNTHGSLNASHRRPLEQLGVVPFPRPVKIGSKPIRFQILRKKSYWLTADLADVKNELARTDVQGSRCPLDYLMGLAAINEAAAGHDPRK